MKKESKFIIIGIIAYIVLLIAYMSALHSIDLSWNASRIENLIDDNGIIKQTPEDMYRHAYKFISWFPIISLLPIMLILTNIQKVKI